MHGMKRQNGHRPGGRGPIGGHGESHGMFGGRRGGGGHGGGMGGSRRGKRFAGEDIQLLLLSLIKEKPSHGYELIKAIDELSGGAYAPSPGVVYPLLSMLVELGHLDESSTANGRKTFQITESGIVYVEGDRNTFERVIGLRAQLKSLASEASRTDTGPVRRAMMNLRTAAVQRMGKEGATDQLAFDVAAILDEAAQKIERL